MRRSRARAAPQSGGYRARAAPQSGGYWARAALQSGGYWAIALVSVVAAACSGGSGDAGGGGTGKAAGAPIVVGMINQEGSPEGSFPEVREDVESAVRYVNEQLGGVGGRPLKLEPCITTGSPESSQACANRLLEKKPVAVIGGVDLGTTASLPVLEKAGIPYVSGSPTLGEELTSPTAFLFTGGAAADLLGQAKYITETLHATKVGVLYVDLPGTLATAVEAARQVLKKKGVTDVYLRDEKASAADFAVALNDINAHDPDAIVVVFPPEGCSRIMAAKESLGVKAKMFYPGACAQQQVFEAAGGGGEGAFFASGYLSYDDDADPEVATYLANRDGGAGGDGGGLSALSQAGFAVVMDLRQLLSDLDGDPDDPAALTRELGQTRDHPGFMGHAYTCDGKQVPLLTSVCNANVRILQQSGGELADVGGGWVNGADLVRLFTG